HAHVEQDGDAWALWVRDENLLDTAKDELEQFKLDPRASRYQQAIAQAESLQRSEHSRRENMRKNVVEMRGRWGHGMPGGGSTPRRAPLVFVLIGVSVLAGMLTGISEKDKKYAGAMQYLLFARPEVTVVAGREFLSFPSNGFEQIARGQVWRLVTPIFIHFGYTHIIFNMWVLYVFGSQVEDRLGTLRLALLVLLIAAASNMGQYLYSEYATTSSFAANFGGMSGVNYGLFGFVWIKSRYQPALGLRVSPFTVFILFAWFFLGILGEFPDSASMVFNFIPRNIANAAHGIGLLMGVLLAYAPLALSSVREKKP
ncbi:MAG: rhomboid family intramembrane serine protease, partial [Candidatus Hydrogenedentales bacterium]